MSDQPRVSRLAIGRLHNLGNYEHIRYEVTVEIPEGASASQAVARLEKLLNDLEPKAPCSDYELKRAVEGIEKADAGTLEDWEQANLPCYRQRVKEHAEWFGNRQKAREHFDNIGGASEYFDAKDKWEDEF